MGSNLNEIAVKDLREKFQGPHELLETSDGKTLFIRRWNAAKESPVSLLIFHGITGYSEPYGPIIAEQLASSGFDVFGMDLRGHGLSDGKRGDYPSPERFVMDLSETVKLVKSKSKKLVLLGHSLGSLSAIVAAKTNQNDIDGLVVLSAAKKMKGNVYTKPKTMALLKTLLGVTIFQGTPLIEYRRQGQLGLNDPLFNFEYSARFYSVLYGVKPREFVTMYRSGFIESPNLKFASRLEVPILVGVGDQDDLFTVEAAKEFYDEIDATDKEFLVIPGARHAFFPKNCWDPLVNWLNRKFA